MAQSFNLGGFGQFVSVDTVGNNITISANSVTIGNSSTGIILGSNSSAAFTGTANNALYLGGTAAASYQLNSTLAANVATLPANNALYLGGTAAASYALLSGASFTGTVNATAHTIGTTWVANASGVYMSMPLSANGSTGTAGQLLYSNGATGAPYWAAAPANYTISTGLINTTGTITVNAAYIATIAANNASYLGDTAAASYVQNTDSRTLSGNLNFTGVNTYFSAPVTFATNTLTIGTSAYFASNGNIGFGTINPTTLLDVGSRFQVVSGVGINVNGSIEGGTAASGGQLSFNFQNSTKAIDFQAGKVSFSGNGNVGINNTSPTDKLSVNGTTYHQGNVILGSSSIAVGLQANGGYGTAGQVLTSNGTATYWSTVSVAAGVNTAAQYTWSNTQTFSNTITFSSTINGTANNASYLGGVAAASYALLAGPTFSGTVNVGSGTLWSNNLLLQGDGTNAYIRPNNTGSVLNLGANGTNYVWLVSNGNVGVGNSAPANKLHISGDVLRIDGTSGEAGPYLYRAGGNAPDIRFFTSNGTIASPTTVANGTNLGQIHFQGYDGTAYRDLAGVWAVVDGTVSTNNVPSALRFFTGSTSQTENMRISSNGNVGVGTTSPAYKLDVNGYVGATRYNLTNTNSTYASGDNYGWTFSGSGYVYLNQTGYTYAQTRISARAGISDDLNATLTLYGGTSGYTTITGSTRSPIFYDTNDTAYYTDPNSTSRTNLINSNRYQSQDNWWWDADGRERMLWVGTSHNYYKTNDMHVFRRMDNTDLHYIASDGNVWMGTYKDWLSTQIRSGIFYDYNDTGYYCDPNSTSRFVRTNINVGEWNYSSEGWVRLLYQNGGSTLMRGGSTSQWVFEVQNHNDGATRWLMAHAGDFYAAGNIIAYWSDKRLKKNIEKIADWKRILSGINGYRFQWNDIGQRMMGVETEEIEVGLIAQEVQAVLPQAAAIQQLQYKGHDADGNLVPKDNIEYDPENPYLTVKEEKIVPVLVEALKAHESEIEELKEKVRKLENIISFMV